MNQSERDGQPVIAAVLAAVFVIVFLMQVIW